MATGKLIFWKTTEEIRDWNAKTQTLQSVKGCYLFFRRTLRSITEKTWTLRWPGWTPPFGSPSTPKEIYSSPTLMHATRKKALLTIILKKVCIHSISILTMNSKLATLGSSCHDRIKPWRHPLFRRLVCVCCFDSHPTHATCTMGTQWGAATASTCCVQMSCTVPRRLLLYSLTFRRLLHPFLNKATVLLFSCFIYAR